MNIFVIFGQKKLDLKSQIFMRDVLAPAEPSSQTRIMIYRGQGFLAVVCFGSSPAPLHPLSRQ
jgi:hypothetical protein